MIIPANPNRQPKILFEVSLSLKNNTARNISQKVPRESIIDALLPLPIRKPHIKTKIMKTGIYKSQIKTARKNPLKILF